MVVSLMYDVLFGVQNGRATPAPISSGPRSSSRPNKGGRAATALANKKRKHTSSPSPSQHSESQDGLGSNASGGEHLRLAWRQLVA